MAQRPHLLGGAGRLWTRIFREVPAYYHEGEDQGVRGALTRYKNGFCKFSLKNIYKPFFIIYNFCQMYSYDKSYHLSKKHKTSYLRPLQMWD